MKHTATGQESFWNIDDTAYVNRFTQPILRVEMSALSNPQFA